MIRTKLFEKESTQTFHVQFSFPINNSLFVKSYELESKDKMEDVKQRFKEYLLQNTSEIANLMDLEVNEVADQISKVLNTFKCDDSYEKPKGYYIS